MALVAGTRLGPFEILAPLGAGGMGEVYRARDSRLAREVAIKVLSAEMARDESALHRLEQEAKSIAALSHPNIVAVHQFDVDNGIAFIATELLEGQTLRRRLTDGPIPWRKAAEIGAFIADALGAAHSKGIVHRDLKPENIFLTSDGRVKVLDFGLARARRALHDDTESTIRRTSPGTILGTVSYMSPEQIRGEIASATSDIFSLGCVLYEMLSGANPFQRSSPAETMAVTLREPPRPLETGDLPAEMIVLIHRCLEKNPEERFQSARDLAFDLRALGSGSAFARTATPASIDSIAVLPFENASKDPEIDYLSEGITETIISKLSQLPRLRVMARSTVYRYRSGPVDPLEVGRVLNVRSVLTGKVMQRGETLTIWTELVNIADGSQLWGERYQRKTADLLRLEEEMAREISDKLRIRLSGKDQERLAAGSTQSTEAHQAYLRGRYHWNKRSESGMKRSVELFNEALEKDPTYALAYVGLADAYNLIGFYSLLSPSEAFPRAEAAARQALELAPSLAEALTSLAYPLFMYRWDLVESERLMRRAIELNDRYPTGHLWYGLRLASEGRRGAEHVEQIRRVLELDPLSLAIGAATGWQLYFTRQFDRSIEQLRKTIALESSFGLAHSWLSATLRMKRLYDDAIREAEKGVALTEMKTIALEALASAYAAAGRRDDAIRVINELMAYSAERYLQPYAMATIHAASGETDEAIRWLTRGLEERSHLMVMVNVDPALDPLRSDPRFDAICSAVVSR